MRTSLVSQRLRSLTDTLGDFGPTLTYVLVFVVGLLIGLVVLGWVVFPVRWTQALPADLRVEYRDDYLRLVAESYALTGDLDAAVRRLEFWPPADMVTLLGRLSLEAEAQGDMTTALRLRRLAEDAYAARTRRAQPTVSPPTAEEAAPATTPTLTLTLLLLVLAALVVLGFLLLIARAIGVWPRSVPVTAPVETEPEEAEVVWEEEETPVPPASDVEAEEEEVALADEEEVEEATLPPWTTPAEARPTVRAEPGPSPSPAVAPVFTPPAAKILRFEGDPAYNETHSISDNQVYLGEYGMGVGQTNPHHPERVYSLEVWLFDKGDINTVTAILLHPDIYADEELRQQAAGPHEAVPLQPGATIHLRTRRLRLDGRVRRVEFGPTGPDGTPIRLAEVEMFGGIL
ncbi:MAG: hypothetical protein RMN24_06925 [Anaerolineae bacterium]|nr:hypothetical protein [Anaerolineae bacterium]